MRLFLDQDGVLADFTSRFIGFFNAPFKVEDINEWNYIFDNSPKSVNYYWNKMDNAEFWARIKPFPWTEKLISCAFQIDPNFTILTHAPLFRPNIFHGKYRWLKKYVPGIVKGKRLAITASKELFAHRNAILIDDNDENVRLFNGFGGIGILWPQPWNENRHLYPVESPATFLMQQFAERNLKSV